jgi:uncharacterized protein
VSRNKKSCFNLWGLTHVLVWVELDHEALEMARPQIDAIDAELRQLGTEFGKILSPDGSYRLISTIFIAGFDAVDVRAFRSGSLSGYNANAVVHHTPVASA